MHLPGRSILVVAAGLLLSSLILGAFGVFALPSSVSDFFAEVTGIRQSTIKALLDPVTGKIPLSLLPTGPGHGLDADKLDGQHASAFATSVELAASRADLESRVDGLNLSVAAGNATTLGGYSASFFRNASNLSSGTLSDQRLSGNVVLVDLAQTIAGLKTFSGGIRVSGGQVTLPPASIIDAALSANVALLTGSQTFSGAKSFSALLTAGNGFTLSAGPLSLPGNSILDSALSANVALLTGTQTFSGAKSFSLGITAPTAGDTINGLVINSGALSGLSTLALSGAITGATSGNTLNGAIFSSGNATLASLTSSTGSLTSTVADGATAVGFTLATSATYSTAGAKLLSVKNNGTEKLFLDKDGLLTVNGNLVATGTIQGTQLISTVLTGTAPLVVSSTTQVANLNANFVQGYQAADLYGAPQPNLIPNSDFSRRTKWMTFMPETFVDTSGVTLLKGSGAGSVAGNLYTVGAAGDGGTRWLGQEGLTTWRDARFSGQMQANQSGAIGKVADGDNFVAAYLQLNGASSTLRLYKRIGGVFTVVTESAAFTATAGNYYWAELEAQGTTYVAKIYSSGVAPVAKASASLVTTVSSTVSDSSVISGALLLWNDGPTPTNKFGGLSTGDGGVYVEGWGPESWTVTWSGTLGGQAIGFDETADSGPLTKQWAMRAYIPATSRQFYIRNTTPDGSVSTATAYTLSGYWKTSGKGGTGALLSWMASWMNSAQSEMSQTRFDDAGETAWTRASGVKASTESTVRRVAVTAWLNVGGTATGTVFFLLPQVEQGSVATPWRNAPADDGPIRLTLVRLAGTNVTTTVSGSSFVDVDPRDAAANVFAPWDAVIEVIVHLSWDNDTSAGGNRLGLQLNGSIWPNDNSGAGATSWHEVTANYWTQQTLVRRSGISAGKHRVNLIFNAISGTARIRSDTYPVVLYVTLTRGK